jgi:ABC-2 type transport system permease protein
VTLTTYIRYELLRTVRNRRLMIFSLAFPLILFFVIAGPNRKENDFGGSGLSAPLYYMVGLVAFGGMNGMLSSGARIAAERTAGWNRQLRITPLRARSYLGAKVVTAYAMALITIGVMYVSGVTLGVSLTAVHWVEMTGLILIGLAPFAALGILIGHLVTADSVGPAIGGTISLFALLGGTWFPLGSGVLHDIGAALPSYWLVQAAHVALGGSGWGVRGWLVVAAWTAVLSLGAMQAYRRDTKRV